MIKIKTKYNYDENIFTIDKLEHKHSCTAEFLALINKLIDEIIEYDENANEKNIYKEIKEFRKNMEDINAH